MGTVSSRAEKKGDGGRRNPASGSNPTKTKAIVMIPQPYDDDRQPSSLPTIPPKEKSAGGMLIISDMPNFGHRRDTIAFVDAQSSKQAQTLSREAAPACQLKGDQAVFSNTTNDPAPARDASPWHRETLPDNSEIICKQTDIAPARGGRRGAMSSMTRDHDGTHALWLTGPITWANQQDEPTIDELKQSLAQACTQAGQLTAQMQARNDEHLRTHIRALTASFPSVKHFRRMQHLLSGSRQRKSPPPADVDPWDFFCMLPTSARRNLEGYLACVHPSVDRATGVDILLNVIDGQISENEAVFILTSPSHILHTSTEFKVNAFNDSLPRETSTTTTSLTKAEHENRLPKITRRVSLSSGDGRRNGRIFDYDHGPQPAGPVTALPQLVKHTTCSSGDHSSQRSDNDSSEGSSEAPSEMPSEMLSKSSSKDSGKESNGYTGPEPRTLSQHVQALHKLDGFVTGELPQAKLCLRRLQRDSSRASDTLGESDPEDDCSVSEEAECCSPSDPRPPTFTRADPRVTTSTAERSSAMMPQHSQVSTLTIENGCGTD
ncbi:hypothetical protein MBLNU459_g1094t1 [Dothideomycetes sp. NU459]